MKPRELWALALLLILCMLWWAPPPLNAMYWLTTKYGKMVSVAFADIGASVSGQILYNLNNVVRGITGYQISGAAQDTITSVGGTLDMHDGALTFPRGTVVQRSGRYPTPQAGDRYDVTNGLTPSDVSTGGGTFTVPSRYDGTAWVPNASVIGTENLVTFYGSTGAPTEKSGFSFNPTSDAFSVPEGGSVNAPCDFAASDCGLQLVTENDPPPDSGDSTLTNLNVNTVGVPSGRLEWIVGGQSVVSCVDTFGGQTIAGNLTLTGQFAAGVSVVIVTADTGTLTAAAMLGHWYINTDTGDAFDRTLAPAAAGLSACFYAATAEVLTLDAEAGDVIQLNGTNLTAGNAIDSAGAAGNFICLLAINDTTWVTLGRSGTFVDGGAD